MVLQISTKTIFLENGMSYFDKVARGGVSNVLPQHDTKCSDETLSGVRVGCEVLQHRHIVQLRWRKGVISKQPKKELRKNRVYFIGTNSFLFAV